jgi:hypothetical protein
MEVCFRAALIVALFLPISSICGSKERPGVQAEMAATVLGASHSEEF